MSILAQAFVAVAALTRVTTAFPAWAFQDFGIEHPQPLVEERQNSPFPTNLTERLGQYIAPGPNDSRGPCPALNTLANHGLINRNGKNLKSDDILTAFPRGFGIDQPGFFQALHNFEVVCEYVKGTTCGLPENNGTFILTNLTLLGEPHAFEHDHSFSRQDYKQDYANGGFDDNIYFNKTIFKTSLDVVGYTPSNPPKYALANYQQFNQIRLQRESLQRQADFPSWFQENVPVQLFEVGFIFGAVFDRDSNGNMIGNTPQVRLDWWNFWFEEESFPTQLGWVPAQTSVFNSQFISSVSSAVLNAVVTSTPVSLPPDALATTFPPPSNLPEADPSPTFVLFPGTAYVAPTPPSNIKNTVSRRDATALPIPSSILSSIAHEVTAAPKIIQSALSAVGPAPRKYDFYKQDLDVDMLKNQIAQAQSYESAVVAAITSLAHL